jgi:cell division protein FtsB
VQGAQGTSPYPQPSNHPERIHEPPLADALGTKTGKFVVEQRKLREEFGAKTDKLRDKLKEFAAENINLREQISQLRTDMTIKAGIASGQISELIASW